MSVRLDEFRRRVWEYYRAHGRHDLPWRDVEPDGRLDPYKVLVSELMLQQTQVTRVIPKFERFVRRFPNIFSLAEAPLAEILREWNGLGYNRRAKFLWQAAGRIVHDHAGVVPNSLPELVALPGIGINTAGAISAYAYNKPNVFIETNVRSVFLYHFFAGKRDVSDKDIAEMVVQTLPDNPRMWYWALMDYGTHLKQTTGNPNTLSKHYAKQSVFVGSKRHIRGRVLRELMNKSLGVKDLRRVIADERLVDVLDDLQREGLVEKRRGRYKLAGS